MGGGAAGTDGGLGAVAAAALRPGARAGGGGGSRDRPRAMMLSTGHVLTNVAGLRT